MSDRLILDHLVYGVPDLTDSINEFEQRLGRTPRLGGRHEGLGTHNAILPLAGERYVELIAIDPDAPFGNGLIPFVINWGKTPHPAASAANNDDLILDKFVATHPDPSPISDALAVLGVELKLENGAEPGLSAKLAGQAGDLVLR